jgi:hypothetical protein
MSERCAPRKKPHANARAAKAFAVTVVVGVLVMAGIFPEVCSTMSEMAEVYASTARPRKMLARH